MPRYRGCYARLHGRAIIDRREKNTQSVQLRAKIHGIGREGRGPFSRFVDAPQTPFGPVCGRMQTMFAAQEGRDVRRVGGDDPIIRDTDSVDPIGLVVQKRPEIDSRPPGVFLSEQKGALSVCLQQRHWAAEFQVNDFHSTD